MIIQRVILPLFLGLFLVGCATPESKTIPVNRITISDIPASFLNCKKPVLPNPKTLTNKQLSSLIFKYEKELNNCIENQENIKRYIAELRAELKRIQG